MGVFVNILIAPGRSEQELRQLMERGGDPNWGLEPEEFLFWQSERGAAVWLNDHCTGYADMTAALSCRLGGPLLLAWIYDDDMWGYDCFTDGQETDCFCPDPDFLEEVTQEEHERLQGRAEVLAPLFQAAPQDLQPYLQPWEEDTFDCWEMADFLEALGFPLPEDEPEADSVAPSGADAPGESVRSAVSYSAMKTHLLCLCADWAMSRDDAAVERSVKELLARPDLREALHSRDFVGEMLHGTLIDPARPASFLRGLLDLIRTIPCTDQTEVAVHKLERAIR